MTRRHGGRRSFPKPEFRWFGFYQSTSVLLPDTNNDIYTLFDPSATSITGEHGATLYRLVGTIWTSCVDTDNGVTTGWVLTMSQVNAAGGVISEIDPLGTSDDWIRDVNTLGQGRVDMPATPTGQRRELIRFDVDTRVRRRVESPDALFFTISATVANRCSYFFNIRALIRTNTR